MALDFKVKDIIHTIVAKFVHAFLPNAKKPYNLRAVFQPELDIHGIASKAEIYNIETDPKVIEDGFTAACELIYYLAADATRSKPRCLTRGSVSPVNTRARRPALPKAPSRRCVCR